MKKKLTPHWPPLSTQIVGNQQLQPIFTASNQPVLVCRCGNEPYIGAEFYYTSKYSKMATIGIIKKITDTHIYSTNGTPYHKGEIEVKPKYIAREEKLNELGIKE